MVSACQVSQVIGINNALLLAVLIVNSVNVSKGLDFLTVCDHVGIHLNL